jgi:putative endonuclease
MSRVVQGPDEPPSLPSKVRMALRRLLNRTPVTPPAPDRNRGVWGENLAVEHLKRKGLRLVAVRHRVDRRNELDAILWDGPTLVFVEVKTRRSEDFGRPVDSVNRAKRAHLSRAAVRYCSRLKRQPRFIRFDVVEVVGEPGDVRLNHIPSAFPLSVPYRPPADRAIAGGG